MPLEHIREGGAKVKTREPGDLPVTVDSFARAGCTGRTGGNPCVSDTVNRVAAPAPLARRPQTRVSCRDQVEAVSDRLRRPRAGAARMGPDRRPRGSGVLRLSALRPE